jgi:hypothetical protein
MNKILKRVLIGAGIFVGVVVLGAGRLCHPFL